MVAAGKNAGSNFAQFAIEAIAGTERNLAVRLRITIDGQTFQAEVEILESEESEQADPPYEPAPIPLSPPIPNPEVGFDLADAAERETVCHSPVTGIVVKIHVEPGQRVHANDVLLVLESMKMETYVSARYDTVIKSVLVAAGNPVKAGQPLIEFEPLNSSRA